MSQLRESVSGPAAASIDFPFEGELIFSPHYSIRMTAPEAQAVEVSIDGGPWRRCRRNESHWWHDWSGYGSGAHVVTARLVHPDGTSETLRPRAVRAALAPVQENAGLQSAGATTEGLGIGRALWVLRNQGVQFVQLWFTDVGGKPWRISLPIEHIDETAFISGITLDGPSTAKSFSSFINLLPDPAAIFRDPTASVPTAAVICDLLEPTEQAPIAVGVRQMLRNAVDALARVEEGLCATMGAEPEFFLLNGRGEPAAEEEVWEFLYELAGTLQKAGIKSEGFRFGPAPGQGRVQMHWANPVRTADHVMLYRWFARVIARRKGLTASFQSHLPSGAGAAGMPVHISLWRGIENVFHDANGWRQTSDRCRHFAGGILAHAGAVCALSSPSRGCYPLRQGAGYVALRPYFNESPDALVKVPERQVHPSGRRLKYRGANSAGNPYLSLASMVLAGADGLKRKLSPAVEAPQALLPSTLDEALASLEHDRDFLRHGGLSDALIDAWVAERRSQPERSAVEA